MSCCAYSVPRYSATRDLRTDLQFNKHIKRVVLILSESNSLYLNAPD